MKYLNLNKLQLLRKDLLFTSPNVRKKLMRNSYKCR